LQIKHSDCFNLQYLEPHSGSHIPQAPAATSIPPKSKSLENPTRKRRAFVNGAGGWVRGGSSLQRRSAQKQSEWRQSIVTIVGRVCRMEEGQSGFVLSDQSLESLRQMAATVSELSAAVATINQSIERSET
jgi:hypothetical protein